MYRRIYDDEEENCYEEYGKVGEICNSDDEEQQEDESEDRRAVCCAWMS
jgi:hypothetical protein